MPYINIINRNIELREDDTLCGCVGELEVAMKTGKTMISHGIWGYSSDHIKQSLFGRGPNLEVPSFCKPYPVPNLPLTATWKWKLENHEFLPQSHLWEGNVPFLS